MVSFHRQKFVLSSDWTSRPWNLFGRDLDVVVRSPSVPSSLGGLEDKQLREVDMRLMWTGAALTLFSLVSSPREAKTRKSRSRNKFRILIGLFRIWTLLCLAVLIENKISMLGCFIFLTHHHLLHDGKCYHPWGYIQLSTG